MTLCRHVLLLLCLLWTAPCLSPVFGQEEAGSGLDLRGTITGEAIASPELTDPPRSGSPVVAGFRSILYPNWKLNGNWSASGAYQFVTRPYFYGDLSTTSYGAKGYILQATLNYARVSDKGSLLVRSGVLSSAFGSFLLRYDDADNALIDMPLEYGYYYAPVSFLGLAGAQIDVTRGKWDGRLQFANSSPSNPRSLFARDQYGNWAGGGGYTIRQGLRVGASAYRGPYLDRHDEYFLPGESNPSKLPSHGVGADAAWTCRHTTMQGEWQRFVMHYTVIPAFRESAGYVEGRQVLAPRWSLAARAGFTNPSAGSGARSLEVASTYRTNRFQLLKFGYELRHYTSGNSSDDHIVGIQFVTTLHMAAAQR